MIIFTSITEMHKAKQNLKSVLKLVLYSMIISIRMLSLSWREKTNKGHNVLTTKESILKYCIYIKIPSLHHSKALIGLQKLVPGHNLVSPHHLPFKLMELRTPHKTHKQVCRVLGGLRFRITESLVESSVLQKYWEPYSNLH